MAYAFVKSPTEMTEAAEEKFPNHKTEVAIASVAFQESHKGVGYLLAPIFGSALN